MELVNSLRLWAKFLETNGYKLNKCVGQGSFGDVFAVTSIGDGQSWAVKRLVARRDIRADSYAMVEIAALASIQHPTVVRLHEVLLSPRLACLVMELAPAGNLEMFVFQGCRLNMNLSNDKNPTCECKSYSTPVTSKENSLFDSRKRESREIRSKPDCAPLQETQIEKGNVKPSRPESNVPSVSACRNDNCTCSRSFSLELAFLSLAFSQVTSALNFCHNIDLAHRDINPSNVLIFNKSLVKLADFGLCFRCRDTNVGDTADSEVKCTDYLGNDHYLAPEVRRHEPFFAKPSDIWSLGCLLYFMLQANHPPIYDSDFTDRFDPSGIVSQVSDDSLREKCLRTLSETCRSAVSARLTVDEVLALWDM
ncbi:hypothetical protein RRG08_044831 [Elysia crispata]|uniref:non-specific serine/threonine protein kinase n=1 Tax=Elysia crispata TaxID=231223 RepID=A0AAE1DP56_9GAST|nr:hypothetical protein RRG08_044831 [Elysia crispata]